VSLKVIGAGYGRTGTMSLKIALEMLGFGPCYHMMEVFRNPGHSYAWHAAALGVSKDLKTVLADYQSTVDWPSTRFWRQLMDENPGSKIVLTERDAAAWYKSASSTIFNVGTPEQLAQIPDPAVRAQTEMARYVVAQATFGGDMSEAHVVDIYKKHNDEVKRTVPPARLLVYDTGAGWEPLCRFLGVPVPEAPYPKTNSTEEFLARRSQMRTAASK
jgi:hypothetical protein